MAGCLISYLNFFARVSCPSYLINQDRAFLGSARERYAGRRVLVVGSGHSAFNAILDLVTLRDSEAATEIVWAIRGAAPDRNYGGGSDDQLPARGALGERRERRHLPHEQPTVGQARGVAHDRPGDRTPARAGRVDERAGRGHRRPGIG